MAYSSIAHMGFALMGLAAGTAFGVQAMLIYMAIYVVMSMGTFAFILSMEKDGEPVTDILRLHMYCQPRTDCGRWRCWCCCSALRACRRCWGSSASTMCCWRRCRRGLTWLAVAGVIASVIGAFYYLRIVYYMYFGEERDGAVSGGSPVLWAMLVASAAIMVVGVVNMFGIEARAAAAAATLVD